MSKSPQSNNYEQCNYNDTEQGHRSLEHPPTYIDTVTEAAGADMADSPPEYDVDFQETKNCEKGTHTTIISHALTHDPNLLIQYLQWQQ